MKTSKTECASDFSDIVIAGLGEKGFQFNSEGVWQPADMVVDNGMQRGYSVYCFNVLVGCEMDTLDGGPISCGWVTNFPGDYIPPPDHILVRYQEGKRAFRKDFTTWPLLKGTNGDDAIASSVGQSVYRLAASDPLTQYGLGETEISRTTKFSIGFNGISHRLPTITSDWNYYSALLSTEPDMFGHRRRPIEGGDDDVASDTSSATMGRSSDGGYA
ncbi:hypothetical protein F5B21DRAFT_522518 [Xylaria acuta]|nr:hypothetical protein F5B21DRAFT_522518 [Xylaria acuta]